ncbi:MAG: hypothetical protein SH850_26295 [Planctomycetaceae bacterium]|nr:hypothetical protein [Planctomycetaceae bacterium]
MSAKFWSLMAAVGLICASAGNLIAQEEAAPPSAAETTAPDLKAQAEQTLEGARRKAKTLAVEVDKSPKAQEITAGILQPIYKLAEQLAFPMFHWIAFAVMATGVVSYALQLVLAKLVVLSRMGFSPAEILSDTLGLVISLIGLVLTTQAAAENSTFTQSPAAVLSATAVGVIAGFIFYRWGQAQEVQATLARTRAVGALK